MINRFKHLRESLSEKTKMLVYIGITILAFLFTSLLPLAFSSDAIPEDGILSTGERGAVVAAYLSNNKSVSVKKLDAPSSGEVKKCESIFSAILAECRLDTAASKTSPEGREYLRLSTAEGDVDICRMWLQDQGDWTNWIDVYFDMDTGFIYYLFSSSVCMNNSSAYINAVEGELTSKTVADGIAMHTGFELQYLSWSGKAEDTAIAYTSLNGEALIWSINCSYHPGALLDIRFSVS